MIANFVPLGNIALGVALGAGVLLIFAMAIAIPRQTVGRKPGSRNRRARGEEAAGIDVRPDGYIDVFANVIEEAGGGLPFVVWISLIGIPIWWLAYLILYWNG